MVGFAKLLFWYQKDQTKSESTIIKGLPNLFDNPPFCTFFSIHLLFPNF